MSVLSDLFTILAEGPPDMSLQPLYDITEHPLLGAKFKGLSAEEQLANRVLAELLLQLRAPAYEDGLDEIGYAIVQQINFQLQKSVEPDVLKSISNTHPGNTTSYRDRFVSPAAWSIISRVTGIKTVGITPPGYGV